MKRSYVIHLFICIVLGMASGYWISLAVANSNIYYGILGILATIASFLNVICGPEKESSNKE